LALLGLHSKESVLLKDDLSWPTTTGTGVGDGGGEEDDEEEEDTVSVLSPFFVGPRSDKEAQE